MSAPLIWIVLPLLAGVGLWFLQKRAALSVILATALCLFLSGLAALFPIGEPIQAGAVILRLEPELFLFGRRLVLDGVDRAMLVYVYSLAAFWLAGVKIAGGHRAVPAFGLGIVPLIVAAWSVEPLLYAGLMLEAAILLGVPMLVPPGERPGRGVLRYLIFLTMGMPLFVIGSWALSGLEANPTNLNLATLTAVFLGLAFAFWLAIFPFFTWAPMLASQAHPYGVSFIFLFIPTTVLLLGLRIIGANGWLETEALFWDVLRLAAVAIILTAGFWAAFQRDLGRLFGYIALAQTGFSLFALSLGNRLGDEIFVMNFLPRGVALGLLGLSIAVLAKNHHTLTYLDLNRAAERSPMAVLGLAFSLLSLSGLPLLAEFPIRIVLLQEVSVAHPVAALFVLIGSMGLLFSVFRLLVVTTGGNLTLTGSGRSGLLETRAQVFLIIFAILAMLVVGLFPGVFYPLMVGILPAFNILP